ncbi:glucokinase [Modicella reniformis]|uniref:Phosphotransferase n=1 Tax=Modicella reniformis TaxID=1440133 RepID=A0A9P6MK99_9FUNG|nr:glucokinase [Modicella reniformis]
MLSALTTVVSITPKPTRRVVLDPFKISYTCDKQRQAVAELVDEFSITPSALVTIKDHFIHELKKGLAKDGETLAMVPVFVSGRLDGSESGSFLTLDIGGTFLRVVFVVLTNGQVTKQQKKYSIDEDLKVGETKVLFVDEHAIKVPAGSEIDLGFTFSFPVLQTTINSGTLIAWTKGFSCPGGVGKDPAALLQDALHKQNMHVRVVSLLNDTVGTLLAHAYQYKNTVIGLGLGTGSNAAYIETVDRITKRKGSMEFATGIKEMVINMEFGAFDKEKIILPLTMFDNKVDRKSLNQGNQIFEKMIAGMYLGEITRNILVNLIDRRLLLDGRSTKEICKVWAFDTSYMSTIEADETPDLDDTRFVLESYLGFASSDPMATLTSTSTSVATSSSSSFTDRQIIKIIVGLVGKRAARLSAMAVAGILEHTQGVGWTEDDGADIGVDGSLFRFYPGFEDDMKEAIEDIFTFEKSCTIDISKIQMRPRLDGSSVGAALCALLAGKTAAVPSSSE